MVRPTISAPTRTQSLEDRMGDSPSYTPGSAPQDDLHKDLAPLNPVSSAGRCLQALQKLEQHTFNMYSVHLENNIQCSVLSRRGSYFGVTPARLDKVLKKTLDVDSVALHKLWNEDVKPVLNQEIEKYFPEEIATEMRARLTALENDLKELEIPKDIWHTNHGTWGNGNTEIASNLPHYLYLAYDTTETSKYLFSQMLENREGSPDENPTEVTWSRAASEDLKTEEIGGVYCEQINQRQYNLWSSGKNRNDAQKKWDDATTASPEDRNQEGFIWENREEPPAVLNCPKDFEAGYTPQIIEEQVQDREADISDFLAKEDGEIPIDSEPPTESFIERPSTTNRIQNAVYVESWGVGGNGFDRDMLLLGVVGVMIGGSALFKCVKRFRGAGKKEKIEV